MHSLKAPSPITVTEAGITICFIDEHLLNALFSMDPTEEGIDTSLSEEQPSKRCLSIEVKEEGSAISSIDLHP